MIQAQKEPEMSVFPTTILLATDGSEDASRATEAAADLANRSQSALHVVHVWHDVPGFAHAFVKRELKRQGQEILDEQVQKIEASGGTVTQAHLRGGRTSDEILKLSEELEVGLLVVGSRGLGTVQRILIGSHSEEIVHHAHVPVLVVRRGESAWPPSRVIIAEDFSDDARKAGELAASIGVLYESQALLVYAHPDLPEVPPGEAREAAAQELGGTRERDEDKLEKRADELGGILESRPEIKVSDGYPAAVILEAAHQESKPPLIVVGSRGLAGIRRTRLGSVSTKIVTAAPGPVLVSPHVE
jgi:nucleotide-binding universal stress UspA family protein